MKKFIFAANLICAIILAACQAAAFNISVNTPTNTPRPQVFDGQRAWEDVAYQVNLGPRIPGTAPHQKQVDWMVSELKKAGWSVEIQTGTEANHPLQNVIARRGAGSPWLILGAHYDTRLYADQDPDNAKRKQPVPGANDGASGVAVLLELARILPENLQSQVWLVMFDIEDQGNIPGWDWILGSRFFANSLTAKPDAAVVVDMIGDSDLNIYKERTSNQNLVQSIWEDAAQAGYAKQFIPQLKFSMEDDHTPFLQRGITAADLIDFDYPAWHTTSDTADKVSPQSLKAVGDTLLKWIVSQ